MSEEIFVAGPFFPRTVEALKSRFPVRLLDSRDAINSLSEEDLSKAMGFATFGWAPAEVIDKMPNLKIVSSFGVGYDGVAAAHAAKKGIMVSHTPDVLNDEVANTVMALILSTSRRVVAYDKYVRAGRWPKEGDAPLTRGIGGKTVGIVGLGRIGEAVAEKLSVFHCDVAYHSRNEKPGVPYRYFASLVDLATNADILVVITPGGPATNKLVNKDVIEALGPEGMLVNVSRGTVVDEEAMVAALQDGRLGSAGLDVFENEPQVPEVLFAMDNVVLTPHIGSATEETRNAMNDRVVENLISYFDTGSPVNPVPECAGLITGN